MCQLGTWGQPLLAAADPAQKSGLRKSFTPQTYPNTSVCVFTHCHPRMHSTALRCLLLPRLLSQLLGKRNCQGAEAHCPGPCPQSAAVETPTGMTRFLLECPGIFLLFFFHGISEQLVSVSHFRNVVVINHYLLHEWKKIKNITGTLSRESFHL